MNIAVLVTELGLKRSYHATIRLARELTNRQHQVWFLTADDFCLDYTDLLSVHGRRVPIRAFRNNKTYLQTVCEEAPVEKLSVSKLDVLLLRDNPVRYLDNRQWARQAVSLFSRFALDEGVLVLNDPGGLSLAQNKLYFQTLPPGVRSKTLISRNPQDIKLFAGELTGDMILKPLQGSGGEGVFLVKKGSNYNFNQLLEASMRGGYVIAQEYLPAATEGDIRLFLMNGEPLQKKGKYAAFRRRRQGEDIRSNMHAGGQVESATVTPDILALCARIAPKLKADGLFLAGLDIVGDKLMEVNVFCPGGIDSMERLEGVSFSAAICEELEKKVDYAQSLERKFDNQELATRICCLKNSIAAPDASLLEAP